jgi:hypothetical protein
MTTPADLPALPEPGSLLGMFNDGTYKLFTADQMHAYASAALAAASPSRAGEVPEALIDLQAILTNADFAKVFPTLAKHRAELQRALIHAMQDATQPRPEVHGLSDEEIEDIAMRDEHWFNAQAGCNRFAWRQFARAIEAAHGISAPPAATTQERHHD